METLAAIEFENSKLSSEELDEFCATQVESLQDKIEAYEQLLDEDAREANDESKKILTYEKIQFETKIFQFLRLVSEILFVIGKHIGEARNQANVLEIKKELLTLLAVLNDNIATVFLHFSPSRPLKLYIFLFTDLCIL